MEKLYVLICSVGDQIYTAGSGVGRLTLELRDLNKRIDELEQPVRDLRKEFDSIKQQLLTRANEQN